MTSPLPKHVPFRPTHARVLEGSTWRRLPVLRLVTRTPSGWRMSMRLDSMGLN
jgi:hypothetical protein